MKLEQIQESIGYLRQDPDYKLDTARVAFTLAVLLAYQKGVQGKFLDVEDLNTSSTHTEQNLEQLPLSFHQMVAYIISDIGFCHKQAEESLRKFYYFNKTKD